VNPRNASFGVSLALCLAADQVTKWWVVANLEHLVDEVQIVPGWFSLVHAQNTGAAFSTMEGQRALFLGFLAVALVVVGDLVRRQPAETRFVPAVLGMILGGALGNGLDRLFQGHVTDFLKVYAGVEPLKSWFVDRFHTNVWPIFNVADSLLLVGVALFGLYWLFQKDGEVRADDVDAPDADAAPSGGA
jgi:signal peptidase II